MGCMEGDAGRGFARLFARLDDETRRCYCDDALGEELRHVLVQFQQCTQAMDHARQVDEATKSLIVNAAPGVHVGSPIIQQHLTELDQLETALKKMQRQLMTHVKERLKNVPEADPRHQADVKMEPSTETDKEQTQLIIKLRTLLTDQSDGTLLNEALEIARTIVRELSQRENTRTEFTSNEQQLYEGLKLLRKAVLKTITATETEDATVFRKILKRLVNKRPVFGVFVRKSEEILAKKEAKAAKAKMVEEKTPRALSPPPAAKSKKRKLSESSEASTTTPTIPATANTAKTSISHVHPKAQLGYTQAMALGDVFALGTFDVCLKHMIEVVIALTPQFTAKDTTLVSSTLFLLVEAVDKVKVLDKRLDRLVCLESLLSVMLTKERLQWEAANWKAVTEKLAHCRKSLETVRRQMSTPMGSAPLPTAKPTPAAKKKKEKVAPSHTRFDD